MSVRDWISLQTSRISTLMVAEYKRPWPWSTFAYVQFGYDFMAWVCSVQTHSGNHDDKRRWNDSSDGDGVTGGSTVTVVRIHCNDDMWIFSPNECDVFCCCDFICQNIHIDEQNERMAGEKKKRKKWHNINITTREMKGNKNI